MLKLSAPLNIVLEDHYINGSKILAEVSDVLSDHLTAFESKINKDDVRIIEEVIIHADYLNLLLQELDEQVKKGEEPHLDFRHFIFEISNAFENVNPDKSSISNVSILKTWNVWNTLKMAIEYYHSYPSKSSGFFYRLFTGNWK